VVDRLEFALDSDLLEPAVTVLVERTGGAGALEVEVFGALCSGALPLSAL
jgi:hypothetical protein